MKRRVSRDAHQQREFFARASYTGKQLLEYAEKFEHNYNNDNHSDYVEDTSVHAVD
jgi:hypothetical protein